MSEVEGSKVIALIFDLSPVHCSVSLRLLFRGRYLLVDLRLEQMAEEVLT